jgi:Lrp/AsnC family leucine-responsive transcriptional regulator
MTYDTEKLLDETGWRILHALQENARISFSELGQHVGLSAPAVAERIRRMEDAGIIKGYHAEIDMTRMGYPISAMIRLNTEGDMCSRFGALSRDIPEIMECYRVTGTDSYIMKVAVASIEHLETLINLLEAYGRLTTSIVLSTSIARRIITASPGLGEAEVGKN